MSGGVCVYCGGWADETVPYLDAAYMPTDERVCVPCIPTHLEAQRELGELLGGHLVKCPTCGHSRWVVPEAAGEGES